MKHKVFVTEKGFPKLYRALQGASPSPDIRGGEIARIPRDSFKTTKCPCLSVSTQENLLEMQDTF